MVMLHRGTPAFPLAWKPTAVSCQVTVAEYVTLRVQVFSKFLTKVEWRRVQLKPCDTIREVIATLKGVAEIENLTSLRVVFSSTTCVKKGCVSVLVIKSGHFGLFVKEFENKGSVRWLRQDDKESGEEFLKRSY